MATINQLHPVVDENTSLSILLHDEFGLLQCVRVKKTVGVGKQYNVEHVVFFRPLKKVQVSILMSSLIINT